MTLVFIGSNRFAQAELVLRFLCATSVFSVSLWCVFCPEFINHRDTENPEVAQRRALSRLFVRCVSVPRAGRLPARSADRASMRARGRRALRRYGPALSEPPRPKRNESRQLPARVPFQASADRHSTGRDVERVCALRLCARRGPKRPPYRSSVRTTALPAASEDLIPQSRPAATSVQDRKSVV